MERVNNIMNCDELLERVDVIMNFMHIMVILIIIIIILKITSIVKLQFKIIEENRKKGEIEKEEE